MIVCSSGLYISYQFNLYSIRQHQKEIILHSDGLKSRLVTFSFPANFSEHKNIDLRFVEEDEMMFDGKMYDIVSQHSSGDSIIIKCIADNIEDDIRSEAGKQINSTQGSTTQRNLSAFKFTSEPFTVEAGSFKFYRILNSSSKIFLSIKNKKAIDCYPNVPSPPPWPCV